MLQQTQVATVEAYFDRFIRRYASVRALARADEAQVLHAWQGMGYYRRARNLHRAARMIVEDFSGRVPDTVADLMKLPGVGRYTAGAIASIAFGKREPILDGNVARVMARLFAIEQPIDEAKIRAVLWTLAQQVVEGRPHPGDMNQAMMELGALVCTPKSPNCLTCPVRRYCAAVEANRADELPHRTQRKAPEAVVHRIIAVQRGDHWLFEQRGDSGLWSGMWQLTTREDGPADSMTQWIARRFGLRIARPQIVGRFEHITTHRRIAFEAYRARVTGGRLRARSGQWRRLDQLDDLPLSNAQRKAIQLLGD